MEMANVRVRRATLDDLAPLTALWQTMHLPHDELGKRITEFQLAETADGKLLGAVGLQLAERQGRVHSEAFFDFAHADLVRPLLWERIQAVARNHGLLRLWSREQAPFWNHCGMQKADEDVMQKLPAVWRGEPAEWRTLKLRDDLETVMSLDKEFALFKESEKQRTARAFYQARILKVIAVVISLAVLALVVVGAILMIRKNPTFLRR